jgi:hypothetical protein
MIFPRQRSGAPKGYPIRSQIAPVNRVTSLCYKRCIAYEFVNKISNKEPFKRNPLLGTINLGILFPSSERFPEWQPHDLVPVYK